MNSLETDAYVHYPAGPLPVDAAAFEQLWALRPDEPQVFAIYGKEIELGRRYVLYGGSYGFAGQEHAGAAQVPEILRPYLQYGNSILVNFYRDGSEYVGYHSDNQRDLVPNQRIHCFSYGAERRFKFQHKQTKEVLDLMLPNNSLLVMKEHTQRLWKHALPVMKKMKEGDTRRVSVTVRTTG